MTILPKSVLVVGRLADKFTADFVARLTAANCAQVGVLWPVAAGETISAENFKYVSSKSLKIFYGTPANGDLVKKIVDENKVDVVFHFNYENDEQNLLKIIDGARKVLATLTQFMEALRKCVAPPTLVEAFFERAASDAQSASRIEAALCNGGRLAGTFRAASPTEANFGSAVALLHSFSISYRLNIQVANFFISSSSNCAANSFDFLTEISSRQKGSAQISTFNISSIAIQPEAKTTERKETARFLVYGSTENEFGAAVCAHFNACGIEYAESHLRADSALTAALSAEILDVAPSHLLHLPQQPESGEDVTVYNASGPQNLLKNARENLFAPLHLANICSKMGGIHFTYFNVYHLQSLRSLLNGTNTDSNTVAKTTELSGKVVADCFSTTKNFTEATLKFFEENVLNAKFNATTHSKAQIQNCAKSLVEFALAQRTGSVEVNV